MWQFPGKDGVISVSRGKKVWRWIWDLPANTMRLLIHIYQHTLSKAFGPVCKYYPSCSHYSDLAFQVHGFWKGLLLTGWRLLRCNPLSDGGVDYPPLKGQWTNPWTEPGSVTRETYGIAEKPRKNKTIEGDGKTVENEKGLMSCC